MGQDVSGEITQASPRTSAAGLSSEPQVPLPRVAWDTSRPAAGTRVPSPPPGLGGSQLFAPSLDILPLPRIVSPGARAQQGLKKCFVGTAGALWGHRLPRPSPDPQGSPRLLSATTCPPLTPLAERLFLGAGGGETRDGKLRDPRSGFFAQRVVGERPVPRLFPRRFTQPVQAASRGSAQSCGLHPACLGCPASTLVPPPEQEVTPIANMNVRLRGESVLGGAGTRWAGQLGSFLGRPSSLRCFWALVSGGMSFLPTPVPASI